MTRNRSYVTTTYTVPWLQKFCPKRPLRGFKCVHIKVINWHIRKGHPIHTVNNHVSGIVIWGPYGHIRDTPDAKRPFLVDVTPCRKNFSEGRFTVILVTEDPCDKSEKCVHARSVVMRPCLRLVFWRRMPLVTLACQWTNEVSETATVCAKTVTPSSPCRKILSPTKK